MTSQEADGQSGECSFVESGVTAEEVEVGGRRETSCTTRGCRHKILESTLNTANSDTVSVQRSALTATEESEDDAEDDVNVSREHSPLKKK